MDTEKASRGAKGDRDRVGDVGGRGGLGKTENSLDSRLHLRLARVPMAGEGFFDLVGLELDEPTPRLTNRQQQHAASVAHDDRRRGMVVMGKERLDRDDLRLETIERLAEITVKLDEPGRNRGGRLGSCTLSLGAPGTLVKPKDPGLKKNGPLGSIGSLFETGVARQPQTGIDAEDSHGESVMRKMP